VSHYMVKPIKMKGLLEILRNVVETDSPAVSAALSKSLAKPEEKPVTPRHILLAEDNPVNQQLAIRLLQKMGHTVVMTGNGREALEAFAKEEFDLILMDVQMPEMDGFAATGTIREQEKVSRKHIPIIAMTARAMKGDRERCLEAGMDDYISK